MMCKYANWLFIYLFFNNFLIFIFVYQKSYPGIIINRKFLEYINTLSMAKSSFHCIGSLCITSSQTDSKFETDSLLERKGSRSQTEANDSNGFNKMP